MMGVELPALELGCLAGQIVTDVEDHLRVAQNLLKREIVICE